jgi:hypothetical protein
MSAGAHLVVRHPNDLAQAADPLLHHTYGGAVGIKRTVHGSQNTVHRDRIRAGA